MRQQDVLDLIRERAATGRTVFLSSHEIDQVEHVADRVAIVREGRLVAVKTIAGLKERAVRRVEGASRRLSRILGPVAERPRGSRSLSRRRRPAPRGRGIHGRLGQELATLPIQTLTSEPPELEEICRRSATAVTLLPDARPEPIVGGSSLALAILALATVIVVVLGSVGLERRTRGSSHGAT